MDPDKFARRRAKWEARKVRRGQRGPESSMVIGALIVVVGLLSLLANIGHLMIHELWSCWPLLIVAAGITTGLKDSRFSILIAASLISAAGALLWLRNLDILAFDSRLIWPVLLIGFGSAKLAEVLDPARETASK